MDKHPLQEAIERSGEFSCRSYSGRCMYGKECLGVEVDRNHSLGDLFADIIASIDEDNREEIEDGVRSLRTDGMGLGEIVYFQDVRFVAKKDDDEDLGEECDECGAKPGEPCNPACPNY